MASSVVSDFIDCPSLVTLEQCTRDQLLIIATHYQIEVSDRKLKETIKATVKACLQEKGVLGGPERSQCVSVGLTFEQQKELLVLKQEHELALEEQKQKLELAKISLQQEKLST